jgi:SAM-dependent methyltransferase
MIDKSKLYWVNNPIFLKIKDRFDFGRFTRVRELKKVHVNERIAEIPFALNAISRLPQNAAVLDIGCAESLLPLYLSYSGVNVTGLDCRDYPYTAPNFKFLKGNILKLPFDNNSFDAVTCISTIEHIGIGFYDDPKQNSAADALAMKEIQRVLKSAGYLILSVPYGIKAANEQQRIYDHSSLKELLKGFNILTQKYFADSPVAGTMCNTWTEVKKEEADTIDCSKKAQCITCLTASLKA